MQPAPHTPVAVRVWDVVERASTARGTGQNVPGMRNSTPSALRRMGTTTTSHPPTPCPPTLGWAQLSITHHRVPPTSPPRCAVPLGNRDQAVAWHDSGRRSQRTTLARRRISSIDRSVWNNGHVGKGGRTTRNTSGFPDPHFTLG